MTFRSRTEALTIARDHDRLPQAHRRAPHRKPASGFGLRVESLENRCLLSSMPPVATTLEATAITSTAATLNGSVNPSGSSTDTLFQYSTDPTLEPHVVTTLAGTAGQGGSADGTGAAALFALPSGISVDAAGNVYVCDEYDTIRKITPEGVVTTFAGQRARAAAPMAPALPRSSQTRKARLWTARGMSMWRTRLTTRSARSRRRASSPRWRERPDRAAAPTAPA